MSSVLLIRLFCGVIFSSFLESSAAERISEVSSTTPWIQAPFFPVLFARFLDSEHSLSRLFLPFLFCSMAVFSTNAFVCLQMKKSVFSPPFRVVKKLRYDTSSSQTLVLSPWLPFSGTFCLCLAPLVDFVDRPLLGLSSSMLRFGPSLPGRNNSPFSLIACFPLFRCFCEIFFESGDDPRSCSVPCDLLFHLSVPYSIFPAEILVPTFLNHSCSSPSYRRTSGNPFPALRYSLLADHTFRSFLLETIVSLTLSFDVVFSRRSS